jgi:hypothetical protein
LQKSKCMVAHYSIEKPGLSKLSAQPFLWILPSDMYLL